MLKFVVSRIDEYDEDGNIIGHPRSIIFTYKPAIFGSRIKTKKQAS
jgi:hypothetical protein